VSYEHPHPENVNADWSLVLPGYARPPADLVVGDWSVGSGPPAERTEGLLSAEIAGVEFLPVSIAAHGITLVVSLAEVAAHLPPVSEELAQHPMTVSADALAGAARLRDVKLLFSNRNSATRSPIFVLFGDAIGVVEGEVSTSFPAAEPHALYAQIEGAKTHYADLEIDLPQPPVGIRAVLSANVVQDGAIEAPIPAPEMPTLTLSTTLSIDLSLPENDGPVMNVPHAEALRRQATLFATAAEQAPLRAPLDARAQHGEFLLGAAARLAHQQAPRASRASVQPVQHGGVLGACALVAQAQTAAHAASVCANAQSSAPARGCTRIRQQAQVPSASPLAARSTSGARRSHSTAIGAQEAARTRMCARVRHQHGVALALSNLHQAIYPTLPSAPAALVFCRLADGRPALVFGCPAAEQPGAPIVVPISEAYLVINDFSLVRVDTGQPIEVEDFSATLDADSWTWGWSASLHADLMPLVRSPALGEHVELLATVNATALHLVVERMGRDRRFANARLKVSGRGRAAWLAAPHAPIDTRYNTEARTAQQLLADALTINGVSIGWSIDWRLSDWLVPAGAWSHQGTYMDAATRIAEAGGGYVQAHNTAQQLIILPRYPAAPWHWASQTPDIDLPEDVCEVEGIEWQDKPTYNAVWVHGGEAGRRDRIRRAGTAADRTAPTIIDPLATAPEMTRQRGLATLGDTGRQAHITLRLPVLEETGIIQPGKLIRYTESGVSRLGFSRSVQVDHRFPDLWQTIRIETHELEPV